MPKSKKACKKLGRDEEIGHEELIRRYAAMKRFLEDNWGRLGLKLPRVRQPEDVGSVLNQVKDVRWCPAFRDFPTGCLLRDGNAQVGWRQLRNTRNKFEEARRLENQLSRQSQIAHQSLQQVKNAYEAAHKGKKEEQLSKEEREYLQKIAKQLGIDEMTRRTNDLSEQSREAQKEREFLEQLLSTQEAWFARNEVLAFVRDSKRRYSKTPANFAKAMAGLPFYDWLYSLRKCLSIPAVANIPKTDLFKVFEMLQKIVKRIRSGNVKKLESKLKSELLADDADPHLRSYISPVWFYMTLAFADCRGKRIHRSHLPYRVLESFLDHRYNPSVEEGELAKLNQLEPSNLDL
jgi:hypothetical protein